MSFGCALRLVLPKNDKISITGRVADPVDHVAARLKPVRVSGVFVKDRRRRASIKRQFRSGIGSHLTDAARLVPGAHFRWRGHVYAAEPRAHTRRQVRGKLHPSTPGFAPVHMHQQVAVHIQPSEQLRGATPLRLALTSQEEKALSV
jgi:hypothetical protein